MAITSSLTLYPAIRSVNHSSDGHLNGLEVLADRSVKRRTALQVQQSLSLRRDGFPE